METAVLEIFYHTVIQAMLLFGAETWVFSAPMTHRMEGFHEGFLRKLTNLKAKILRDGLWRKVVVDKVLQGSGTKLLLKYLDRRQGKVEKWVALRPIFDVFARDTSYTGGGELRVPPWRKETK